MAVVLCAPACADDPAPPLYPNLGSFHRQVSTHSMQALRYVNQGLRFLFSFHYGRVDSGVPARGGDRSEVRHGVVGALPWRTGRTSTIPLSLRSARRAALDALQKRHRHSPTRLPSSGHS